MTRTILVVEDDQALREAIAEILLDEGLEVARSANGWDALTKLRSGLRPHLILLDLMMPVMDGWEFRSEQLKDPELAQIPVVVMTAAGKMKPIDSRAVMQKPFRLEELLSVLATAM